MCPKTIAFVSFAFSYSKSIYNAVEKAYRVVLKNVNIKYANLKINMTKRSNKRNMNYYKPDSFIIFEKIMLGA